MSAVIPYFNFYPANFMHGVRGMSAHEVGVYTMILCRIYEENGPVEMNEMRLATYCGMRVSTFRVTLKKLIELGKIELTNGMISNDRAGIEIASRAHKMKLNFSAGKASAEKRQQNQQNISTGVQRAFNHIDIEKEDKKEPLSPLREDKGAEPDFVKALFQNGVQFLIAHGNTEKSARAIIGKWRKGNADAQIYAAFAAAKKNDVVEPVAYITQVLNGDENERLKRWGIPVINSRDFERSRNPGEPDPWDTKVDLSKVQPSTEICEPCDPLFERDVFIGRDSVAMPSLRA